jgi:hypothetical protein
VASSEKVGQAVTTDLKLYLQCMERVTSGPPTRFSCGKYKQVTHTPKRRTHSSALPKGLEEVAFSSLCANREKYSAIHAKFATFWRAKDLLKEIGQINPYFYPVSIRPAKQIQVEDGRKLTHFAATADDCLTKDEFVHLYTKASEVLHSRNPYRQDDATINVKYTVPEWLVKIKNLLAVHTIQLIDNEEGG